MRKLALTAVLIFSVTTMACGSSEEPVNDNGMTDIVETDAIDDVEQDIQVQTDVPVDTGTDNAWLDFGAQDYVEDIPEGPFWAREEGDLVTVTDGRITVELNLVEGTFNIGFTPGLDGIINGHSEAHVKSVEGTSVISSRNPSQRAVWQAAQITDGLDDGVTVMLETIPTGSIGGLRTYISLHRNTPAVTVKLMVALPIREGFLITKLSPVVARGTDGGGLLLGPGTAAARMVTGGHEIAYDPNAEALNVTEAVETLNAPGYLSNWYSMTCTKEGKCLLAGFLNVVRGFGGVAVKSDPMSAFAVGDDAALALFELRSTILQGSMVTPSRVLTSEMAYLDFNEDPAGALNRYATAIATFNGLSEPSDPAAMFVARVDQENLDSNEVAALVDGSLKNAGYDGFIVDRGWEDDEKNPDSTMFPNHGSDNAMKWIADTIKAEGLAAGIALSPFWFKDSSTFYADHEEWMVKPGELAIVRLGLGVSAGILDLSVEEARNWAVNYVKTAVTTWGYDYVRLYGADVACMGEGGSGNGTAAIESLRTFLEELREALGDGPVIELADSTMLGLGLTDAISVTDPQYKSWDPPASKVDATLQMGALSWGHKAFLDDVVFNVVPGMVFDFSESGNLSTHDLLGMRLWAVTGGVPNLAETTGDLASELTRSLVTAPLATDMMEVKIPETWYSTIESPVGNGYLAGFFRFSGNMDLYSLAQADGGRERSLELPVTEGSWAALEPFISQMATVGGACVNPDGADVTLNQADTSTLLVLRNLGDGTQPVFMGLSPTVAGGDTFITDATSGAGSLELEIQTTGTDNLTALFAVPKGASATLSVSDATEVDSGVMTDMCSDIDIAYIVFTPDTVSATVTVTI